MKNVKNDKSLVSPRHKSTLGILLLLSMTLLTGCSLNRMFTRQFWHEAFVVEDPYEVLRNSRDGNKRADALARIEEPQQIGGSRAQQDYVVELLHKAAKSEPTVYGRLAAIQAMARFQDPRVVRGLEDAYYASDLDQYPTEQANVLRRQVLMALGEVRHPSGIKLLNSVLNAPAVDRETSEKEKQFNLDERIAAARALAKFNRDPQATDALKQVLAREKNVALRNRARESLEVVSGVRPGEDAPVIDKMIYSVTPSPRGSDQDDRPEPRPVVLTSGGNREKP